MIPGTEATSRRAGVAGVAALGTAAGCLVTTALLGPSAAEPALRAGSRLVPPWHVDAAPPPWLVTLLLAVAVAAGAAAMWLVVSRRWRPRARPVALAGASVAAVLAFLPPLGSSDPLSYAAYGHMVTTGHDPYTTAPSSLAAHDPVARAVEPPWQHEPAVYGPLATAEQAAAAFVAGDDPARIVLVLDLLGGVAFIGVGILLLRRAEDEDGRTRAAVLWLANPLLWVTAVAGAHVDVVVAALAVAAVAVTLRRAPTTGHAVAAGALAGAAAAVKPPGGLTWVAVAWAHRHDRARLVSASVTAALVAAASYAVVGTAALHRLSRAGRRVSHATPWRPLLEWTHLPRGVIGALAIGLAVALVVAMLRRTSATTTAVAAAVTIGYVLAAPYALPWYDVLPWALLPLAMASWRDWVLLAHTTVLTLAYIPGRDAVRLDGALHTATAAMRDGVAPALLTALVVGVLVIGLVSRSARFRGSG